MGLPADKFINPYTFVPFPDGADISRGEPAGHKLLAEDRYCGRIEITAQARTAIVIGGWQDSAGGPLLPWRPGPSGARQAIIPGSSLAGAVRSMHEALAGGCLRVFDRDFVPVYRDLAVPGAFDELEMVVVTEVDERGCPTMARRCREVSWTDAVALQERIRPTCLRTGLLLDVLDGDISNKKEVAGRTTVDVDEAGVRDELATDDSVTGWVVLVGDAGARDKVKVFRVAVGRLDDPAEPIEVDDQVWRSYCDAALGSADMRRHRKDPHRLDRLRQAEGGQPPMAAVRWHGLSIGDRQQVRPWTAPGTVLWIRSSGPAVTEIRRAVLWRSPGEGAAGMRIPPELTACSKWGHLCPSCRLFGSADVEGRKPDDPALQNSYAGHVRFTDLVAKGRAPDDGKVLALAPLSSPRPGAGQFYLDNSGRPTVSEHEEDVLRRWGSTAADAPDAPDWRHVRGRKFYWLTTPANRANGPRRSERRAGHTNDDVMIKVRAFPFDQKFTTVATFDGLTEAEIGALLAALQPGLVIAPASTHGNQAATVCLPIGGAKPLDYGALTTTVTLRSVDTAQSRYGIADPPPVTVDSAVAAFRRTVPAGIAQRVWPALSAVLTVDHVSPARVWYPPGAAWDLHDPGAKQNLERFDQGFEFWEQTSGRLLKKEVRELVSLPDPAAGADAQYLWIKPGEQK